MKHLKLFEAYYTLSDNEYYSIISEHEYRNMKLEIPKYGPNINKTIIIPDRDYFRIESIIDKIEKSENSDIRIVTRPYTLDCITEIQILLNSQLSIRCGGERIEIYLIEDEWYIVKINTINYHDLHYKCDQIEGLEKFLMDLFEEKKPSAKQISDYKNFRANESKMIDYEDYIFSKIEKDPIFQDIGENWIYLEYGSIEMDLYLDIKTYLDGVRFKDKRVFNEYEYGDLYILIIDEDFYENNIKIDELNWVDHPILDGLKKTNIDLSTFGYMQYAKMVKGLPNDCSLIRGLNSSMGIEFWPQQVEPDPIFVKNYIELQYLLYKYTT